MTQSFEEFVKSFESEDDDDVKKSHIVSMIGLLEEAYDCKNEIVELKGRIRTLRDKGIRFEHVAKYEKLLIQKRANYTNMMGRLCRELRTKEVEKVENEFEGLEDYE